MNIAINQTPKTPNPSDSSTELYSQTGNSAFESIMAQRTAEKEGAFFLKHLKRNLRVLDIGCAAGSITVGFAQAVNQSEVFGIDFQPSEVAKANALATKLGIRNAKFSVASAYELPFEDNSIDAIFANAVLWHLKEPERALAEMHRVLRLDGIVGIRDCDWGARIHSPMTPILKEWYNMTIRVRQHNGGDPFFGRNQHRLLLDNKFTQIETSASAWIAATPDEVKNCATFLKAQLNGFAKTALSNGWMTQKDVEEVANEIDIWAKLPNAFYSDVYFEAVARKID